MLGNTFRKYDSEHLSNNTGAEMSTIYNSSENNLWHLAGRIHNSETALEEYC